MDGGATKFNRDFCARIRKLREGRGWTQLQMATALGIPLDRYRKYEKRSPLPHHLIERFSLIVGRDAGFLLTGKEPGKRARLPLQNVESSPSR
jgi:transcriptional regulator with XRE-family HTH domain